jgi:hypothetical protein
LCLALVGCRSEFKPEPRPDGVLSEEELIEVMVDIYLVEARYQRRLTPVGSDPIQFTKHQYQNVLANHGLTQESFDSTYSWYLKYPAMMGEIHEEILTELQKQQMDIESGNPNLGPPDSEDDELDETVQSEEDR